MYSKWHQRELTQLRVLMSRLHANDGIAAASGSSLATSLVPSGDWCKGCPKAALRSPSPLHL